MKMTVRYQADDPKTGMPLGELAIIIQSVSQPWNLAGLPRVRITRRGTIRSIEFTTDVDPATLKDLRA